LRPEPGLDLEYHSGNHGILFFESGEWLAYIRVNGQYESVVTRFPDGTMEESEPWDSVKDLAISPDGRTLTYVATRGNVSHFVANGNAGPPYSEINTSARTVFSNDGRHWAYTAWQDERRNIVVHDGTADPFNIAISTTPFFSAKSGKMVYQAWNGETNPDKTRSFVVVDGKPGKEYHHIVGPIQLKPDTDEPVYIAENAKARFLVVGESEGKAYQNVYRPLISADGRTITYFAEVGRRKSIVVVNGVETGPAGCCADVSAIVMDPDGKRIGYPVSDKADTERAKVRYMLNGVASTQTYDWIKNAILTRPESPRARVAFVTVRTLPSAFRNAVVVDDTMGPEYATTRDLHFLADGSLFYVAEEERMAFPVHEEEPGPKFDEIRDFTVSSDGKALAFCGIRQGKAYMVRWNGTGWTESASFDSIASPVLFNAAGEVVYRASRVNKQFVVVGEKEQAPYDEIHEVRLGLDGQGMLVVASVGRKMLLVLDGREIATHEGIGDLGTPEKYRKPQQEVVTASGRVNTFVARDTFYLQLNDRTIFTSDVSGAPPIVFQGRAKDEDVLLLDTYQGDGCPEITVLIGIKSGNRPFMSQPFGSCHSAPSVKTLPDRLEISYQDEDNHLAERWVYQPGISPSLAKVK